MKNKIMITTIIINIMIYFSFNILNLFPDINKYYNHAFLSTKLLSVYISLTIIMFIVFGYSILTYIIAFISYFGLISTVLRYFFPVESYLSLGNFSNAINYLLALLLTFLTFYILKKCKINLNVPANKKEA